MGYVKQTSHHMLTYACESWRDEPNFANVFLLASLPHTYQGTDIYYVNHPKDSSLLQD